MIKFKFPLMVVRKARRMCRGVEKDGSTQTDRDRLSQERFGLSHKYLSRVGSVNKTPSNRVLLNMGFELWLKDTETGEMELVNLAEESPWDWSTANPRMRATSISSSES